MKRTLCLPIFLAILAATGRIPEALARSQGDVKTLTQKVSANNGISVFKIHAKQENLVLARRVGQILGQYGGKILNYFDYRPTSPIHIIFDDQKSVANGIAKTFPRNHITIFPFPPTGASFLAGPEDNLKVIVLHELVHAVHLDQTDGINQAIRSVFGSLGKLMPSWVPAWFAEGVATWAESAFTQGGRLRHHLVRRTVADTLMDTRRCFDISCLENRGNYPWFDSAYWIGGDFIAWIEGRQKGAVRCLVKRNSRYVAFFLDRAFRLCLGANVDQLFARYLRQRRQEIGRRKASLLGSSLVRDNLKALPINGIIDMQKGMALAGKTLLHVQDHHKAGKKLHAFHLTDHTDTVIPVKKRVNFLLPPGRFSQKQAEVLALTEEHHRMRWRREVLSLKDGVLLDRKARAEYAFRLDKEETVFLRWNRLAWELHSSKSPRPLRRFEQLLAIARPHLFRGRLTFAAFDRRHQRPYQLWELPLSDPEKATVLFKSHLPFRYFGPCREVHPVYDFAGNLHFAGSDVRPRQTPWPDNIATMVWSEQDTVLALTDAPGALYHFKGGCREIFRRLSQGRALVAPAASPPGPPPKPAKAAVGDYSPLSYAYPKWWLLSYSNANHAQRLSLLSSISDPRERHRLGLNLKWFYHQSVFAPTIEYRYQPSDYIAALSYDHHLQRRNIAGQAEKYVYRRGSLGVRLRLGPFLYTPLVGYTQFTEKDIISERSGEGFSLRQNFLRRGVMQSDLWRQTKLSVLTAHLRPRGSESFWQLQSRLESALAPTDDLLVHLKFTYGKNFKDTLAGGALFGGGQDGESLHDFYGLPPNRAFGNRLLSARIQLERETLRPYKSWGLFPVTLKTVNLLAGLERIEAEHIYTNRFLPDEGLNSLHLGTRFALKLFYNLNANWDLLYIQTGGQDSQVALLVNVPLVF